MALLTLGKSFTVWIMSRTRAFFRRSIAEMEEFAHAAHGVSFCFSLDGWVFDDLDGKNGMDIFIALLFFVMGERASD